MKHILILSGSPRRGGNSDLLCDQFMAGAQAAGHQVEKIFVAGQRIAPCTGCYACRTGRCIFQDDAPAIVEKMLQADVIVLGTAVYFYSMTAQLKALIDRSVMVYPRIQGKVFYYIMTMGDDEPAFDSTLAALRGFAACCDGSTEGGMVKAHNLYPAGAVRETPFMQEAYDLGRSV